MIPRRAAPAQQLLSHLTASLNPLRPQFWAFTLVANHSREWPYSKCYEDFRRFCNSRRSLGAIWRLATLPGGTGRGGGLAASGKMDQGNYGETCHMEAPLPLSVSTATRAAGKVPTPVPVWKHQGDVWPLAFTLTEEYGRTGLYTEFPSIPQWKQALALDTLLPS